MSGGRDMPAFGDIDLRGFTDALAPVRQRQQWRIDRLQQALAQARQALAGTEAALAALRERQDALQREAGLAQGQRVDPGGRARALAWWNRLATQERALQAERDERRQACERARAECADAQLRLEGMERQRDTLREAHALELRRAQAVERDRDWLARRPLPGDPA